MAKLNNQRPSVFLAQKVRVRTSPALSKCVSTNRYQIVPFNRFNFLRWPVIRITFSLTPLQLGPFCSLRIQFCTIFLPLSVSRCPPVCCYGGLTPMQHTPEYLSFSWCIPPWAIVIPTALHLLDREPPRSLVYSLLLFWNEKGNSR